MVRRYSRSRDATVHSRGMRRSDETHHSTRIHQEVRSQGRTIRTIHHHPLRRDEYVEDFRYERERSSSTRRGSTHRSKGSRYDSRGSRERYSSGRTDEKVEETTRGGTRGYTKLTVEIPLIHQPCPIGRLMSIARFR